MYYHAEFGRSALKGVGSAVPACPIEPQYRIMTETGDRWNPAYVGWEPRRHG